MKLKELVKKHIIKVVKTTESLKKAREVLGISERTLRNYLNRYGMGYKDRGCYSVEGYRSITPEERDHFESMDYY